jgi:membrane-associated protease RseP (regulator of RpoE activity)
MNRTFFIILLAALLAGAAFPARGQQEPLPAPPSQEDIDAQYAAVLAAMKHPHATGVLVTEIAPASPAGAAGLRGGDIITRLATEDVRTLKALREQVAELIASNIAGGKETKVVLTARRAMANSGKTAETNPAAETVETVLLQVPREPLGIRAIEVEAALPAPLNPPISPRGSFVMTWDQLRNAQNAGGDLGQETFLRNTQADDTWLGWQ